MKVSSIVISLLFLLALPGLYSCRQVEQVKAFDLEGKCFLTFINNTEEPATIYIRNQYLIPVTSREIDTTLAPRGAMKLELIAQGNNFIDLALNGKEFKVLSRPGSADEVRITEDGAERKILFSGDLQPINEYLLRKSEQYNAAESDILPRVEATHKSDSYEQVLKINDDLTREQLSFLTKNSTVLPAWFIVFEQKRLQYLNAHFKLNSFSYRKELLNKKDSIPDRFLESTMSSLPVVDEAMNGNVTYMLFLGSYIGFRAGLHLKNDRPNSNEAWYNRFNHLLKVADRELTGRVKDVFLAYELSNILNFKSTIFAPEWLNLISDEKLSSFLAGQITTGPVLPAGASIPGFFLADTGNVYYQPNQFKNKIVLINFWATWCKPCFREFSYENALVNQFKEEPVVILNICIESDSVQWKKAIKKHASKPLNLFARGEWSRKLNERFDIKGLPHSVLIDWKGKVVQNKCPRPSENVDQLIKDQLAKMKAAAGASEKNREPGTTN